MDRRSLDFDETGNRQWFVRKFGSHTMTFVVFRPDSFLVGSPESESERRPMENQHRVHLTRAFAIADREVTRAQFEEFRKEMNQPVKPKDYSPSPDHPIVGPNWYEAVLFCRWMSIRSSVTADRAGRAMGPSLWLDTTYCQSKLTLKCPVEATSRSR